MRRGEKSRERLVIMKFIQDIEKIWRVQKRMKSEDSDSRELDTGKLKRRRREEG